MIYFPCSKYLLLPTRKEEKSYFLEFLMQARINYNYNFNPKGTNYDCGRRQSNIFSFIFFFLAGAGVGEGGEVKT